MSKKPNGINIQLTPSQFDMVYDLIMDAYSNNVPDLKGLDMKTYDNMVYNVFNGKSNILSNEVKRIMPVK